MIPPTIALVGIGRRRGWVPLPVPVVLAWPLVALALGIMAIRERLPSPGARGIPGTARTILVGLCQLSGLSVDVVTARGGRLRLWML